MKWRRGLSFAGIHLVVAGTLLVWFEVRDAQHMKARAEAAAEAARNPEQEKTRAKEIADAVRETAASEHTTVSEATDKESSTVTIDPCGMWVHYSVQESVMQMVNLPAFLLTEWRELCPARWTLSGILEGSNRTRIWNPPRDIQRKVDLGLCLLIVLQWILVAGFPLRKPERWWGEPGALITACAVVAGCFAMIPIVDGFARAPAVIALFSWLWWFILLVWTVIRGGWRLVLPTKPQAA